MENSHLNNAYTDRMKCPMPGFLVQIGKNDLTSLRFDCLGSGCGVWDDEKHCCSVKVIALELTRIQQKMSALGSPKGGLN